jgi:hypothetical protein
MEEIGLSVCLDGRLKRVSPSLQIQSTLIDRISSKLSRIYELHHQMHYSDVGHIVAIVSSQTYINFFLNKTHIAASCQGMYEMMQPL